MHTSRLLRSFLCLLVGLVTTTAAAQQGSYSARIDGPNVGDLFGTTLAITTDSYIQPDGLPDLIVGAPSTSSGRLYWYSLAAGVPVELEQANGGVGERWGLHSLDSGADLDQDGWDEILFVSNGYGHLMSGISPHTIRQFSTYSGEVFDQFVGDFDGDTVADFGGRREVYWSIVRSGATQGGVLFSFSDGNYGAAHQCIDAGDLNRDGYSEVLATHPNREGRLTAYAGAPAGFGGAVLWSFYGETSGDALQGVCNVGDWTGDMIDDFAVGSPYVDVGTMTNTGRIYIVSGASGTEISRFDGFAANLGMGGGRTLKATDLTGDGQDELIIGLPQHDPVQGSDAGAIRVFEWTGSSLRLLFGADGDAAGDQFGSAVVVGGDIDGDGIRDFAVSSPTADPSGRADAGSVFVFSGFAHGGYPTIEAQSSARPGDSVPVDLVNGIPGQHFVLVASPNLRGTNLFGHLFEVGQPVYVVAVGGKISISSRMSVLFQVPAPFPIGLPFTIYLEGMLLDPWGVPYSAVSSTNSLPLLVH